MFSLIIAFLIYLFQVSISHLPWNEALIIASKFVFYWNFIFSCITAFFFLLMLIGMSTILLKVPFIGVGIYRFNEKIRQTGIIVFLLKTSLLWLTSKAFILIGSYFLAYEFPTRTDLIFASMGLILLGYLIKRISAKRSGSNFRTHFSIQNLDRNLTKEKDVSPTQPIQIETHIEKEN